MTEATGTLAIGDRVIAETPSDGTISFDLKRIDPDAGPVFWCRLWSCLRTVFKGNAWHFPERGRMSGPGAVLAVIDHTDTDATVRLELPAGAEVRVWRNGQ